MLMFKKISLFVLFALSAAMASCTKEAPADELTVGVVKFTFDNSGGSHDIVFNSNVDWKIESDSDWVTFDQDKGNPGNITVKMTVAPNTSYEKRSAKVTLTAGGKTTTFNVEQSHVSEFGSSIVYEIDSEEQDIIVKVKSNILYNVEVSQEAAEWLRVLKTKSEPSEGTIIMHVSANSGLEKRKGSFTVKAADFSQTYEVVQDADYITTSFSKALYLKNRQNIYDHENNAYTLFHQYAIILRTDDGDELTLVTNSGNIVSKAEVPSGTYNIDASGAHADNTFSVKSTGGHEDYYTTLVVSGKEIMIVDGEITISYENNQYTITAILFDALEGQHRYSYIGAIQVEDNSFGANVFENPTFRGTYNTHFETKANEWTLSLVISDQAKAGDPHLSFITFNFFSPAGENDGQEIPTGTYNWAVPVVNTENAYPNGNLQAAEFTYQISANDIEFNNVEHQNGKSGTLEIIKNDDGTYKFKYAASLVRKKNVVDSEGNVISTEETPFEYKAVYEKVVIEKVVKGLSPTLDGDVEFSSVLNSKYVALWFGDVFNTSCNVFTFSFTDINSAYTVYLTINVGGVWVFEKNFAKRYCNTPFRQGTFNFSATAVEDSLIPAKYSGNPYTYIQNTYTGTRYNIIGGSITLDGENIVYNNIEGKDKNGNVHKFTGTHKASMYYARDNSKNASKLTL